MTRPRDTRPWHRRRWSRVALRLAGAFLLVLAWLAGTLLQSRADHHLGGSVVNGGLALVSFLTASTGSAGLVMGDHLFDHVPVAERWRPTSRDR